VEMHTTDLVGINVITRFLLVYTCQQGVYPRGHVLLLRLPLNFPIILLITVIPGSDGRSSKQASTALHCRSTH
jgi:hypothetical protein